MLPSYVLATARHWRNALSVSVAIGLGLGLNLAVFALLNELLLRPPPYPDANRLIVSDGLISDQEFQSWRHATQSLESLAGFVSGHVTLVVDGRASRVEASRISPSAFALLRTTPLAGRVLSTTDSADEAVLVSQRAARRLFGSVELALGRYVRLDGPSLQIVGVLPPSFRFPSSAVEFWRPLGPQTQVRRSAEGKVSVLATTFPIIARLKATATIEQAERELAGVRGERADGTIALRTLQASGAREVHSSIVLLQWAVLLILALGVCNAMLLMFAHYRHRGREFAIRAALGAGASRIVTDLTKESVCIGLPVAAVSGLTAMFSLALLRPAIGPDVSHVTLDWPLLIAGALVAALLLIAASITAASSALRQLDSCDLRVAGVAPRGRIRHLLLTLQIAMSGVLVIVSVSAVTSLGRALGAPPASAAHDVLAADVHLVDAAYNTIGARVAFAKRLIQSIGSLEHPAAVVGALPFSERDDNGRLRSPTAPRTTSARTAGDVATHYIITSPGYFQIMRWPVLRGREFAWEDSEHAEPVTVITRAMAKERFGHSDVVGERLRFGARNWRVVGVVDDIDPAPGLAGTPTAYISLQQLPASAQLGLRKMTVVVASPSSTADLGRQLGEAVISIDPEVALSGVSTLERRFANAASFLAFFRDLLGMMAGLALAIGAFGLYGVVAAIVGERRTEIAVRLSLGASRRQIFTSVFGLGLRPIVAGLLLAVPGGFVLHRALRAAVPGILPLDVWSIVAVTALIAGVAAVACLAPGLRAARTDPALLLKS